MYVCLCVRGEKHGNGHETRCATLSHLSGCSIMWNHSATLIPLLTPLIDICAPCSFPAQPEVNARRVDGPFPLYTLAECSCVFAVFFLGGSDQKRNTTDNLGGGLFPGCSIQPIVTRDSLYISFFSNSTTCETI